MKKISLIEFDRFENNQPVNSLPTFEEFIIAILNSLKNLGYDVNYKKNHLDSNSINLLIGSHRLFYNFENINFKEKYFVINLEPLDEEIYKNMNEETKIRFKRYLNFLKKSSVIDYSFLNKKIINQFHKKIEIFKFGYFNFNRNFLKNKPNNEFIFYGNCGERRTKIFTKLIVEKKLPINILHNIWGLFRDHEIINSLGIINIHRSSNVPLEAYRVWHSLCLGQNIISEKGSDKLLDNYFNDFITFITDPLSINNENLFNQTKKLDFTETSFQDNLKDLIKKIEI